MAEAKSGVLQASVIGPILFGIYVKDLPDRLSADSPLLADIVKLIAPRNRHHILQNSLNISASWSRDRELDLNPTKSKHFEQTEEFAGRLASARELSQSDKNNVHLISC